MRTTFKTTVKLIMFLLVMAAIMVAAMQNVEASDADIMIKVNGIEPSSAPLYSEIGELLNIKVAVRTAYDVEDARVKAWIDGYEYDLLEDSSEEMDFEAGVLKSVTLKIKIPEDMNLDVNDYSLVVEVAGRYFYASEKYELYIQKPRHLVGITDVYMVPSGFAKPDSLIAIKARIKNQGLKDESDVSVTAAIPEMGISAREWIDVLESGKENAITKTIYIRLPANAAEGTYKVIVEVLYNNGRDKTVYESRLKVEDGEPESHSDKTTITSIVLPREKAVTGEQQIITINVANLGSSKKTYFLEVFGDAEISGPLTLDENEAGELYVYFTPEISGRHHIEINVKTKSGKVASYSVAIEAEDSRDEWVWAASVMVIIAAVAVVIIAKRIDAQEYQKI